MFFLSRDVEQVWKRQEQRFSTFSQELSSRQDFFPRSSASQQIE